MIYTFYSYKGGVGRSMALVNVAELMYRAGQKVIILDWDLEAPGLEKFYPDLAEKVLKSPGIIDLLVNYKEKAARYRPDSSDPLFSPDDVKLLLIDMHPDESDGGKLWLLPAGQRAGEQFVNYANRVKTFDWQDFYQNWEGEVYFEWLRQQLVALGDVVLIDARTGVTEMGGVTTYQLADVIVMLCTANQQNLEGTQQMVDSFSNPSLPELRRGRELKVLVIPARVERLAETTRLNRFREDFASRFRRHLRDFQWPDQDPLSLVDLEIPYVPLYAFEEKIAVAQGNVETRSVELETAYSQLYQVLNPQQSSYLEAAALSEICTDLHLIIERKTPGGPLVVSVSSAIGTVEGDFAGSSLPFFPISESVRTEEAQTIGIQLFRSIFSGERLAHYRRCQRLTEQSEKSLLIKIDVRDSVAASVAWEYLYDDERDEFLALSRRTPLIRFLKSTGRSLPDSTIGPLRILAMGASPSNMFQLALDRELMCLQTATAELVRHGLVELYWEAGQKLVDLRSALLKGPWHAFHFMGMGALDDQQRGAIVLTDENGLAESVNARQLGQLLAAHDSLRTVVLNCSSSASNNGEGPYASLAASLVRSGIPVVVGMQSMLSDRTAIQFSDSFYRSISTGNPVEIAVTDARRAISLVVDQDAEWAAPVLFTSQNSTILVNPNRLHERTLGV